MLAVKRKAIPDLTIPGLVELVLDEERISLRYYEEVPLPDAFEDGVFPSLGVHLSGGRGSVAGSQVLFDGALLAPRLAGKAFREAGASGIDLTAAYGPAAGAEWSDHGLWVFPAGGNGLLGTPYNYVCSNMETKAVPGRNCSLHGQTAILFLTAPFAASRLSGCGLYLRYNPEYGFVSNVVLDALAAEDGVWDSGFWADKFPKLSAEGGGRIMAGTAGAVTVRALSPAGGDPLPDAACELYLEATGGYLPRRRVPMQGGVAHFRVQALGLEPGETFRVKVGYRLWSGELDIPFEVI